MLMVAGCAAPGPRSRRLAQIEAPSQTNLIAYRSGTNLELRLPLHWPDPFAHAAWSAPEQGATNFQRRFAVLDFDQQKRAARLSMTSKTNRVAVHGIKQWQSLMENVFANLAPTEPNHAVLLLLRNHDLAIFHEPGGKVRVLKQEDLPPEVTVDGVCDALDFAGKALQWLQSDPSFKGQTQFLFVTGDDPAFVLLDARERLIVFLDYPADPDTQPAPVAFAARALHSLLIRSLVITAVKNPVTLVCRGLWHLGTSGTTAFNTLGGNSAGPPPPLTNGPPMDLAAWEKQLDKMVSARRQKGRVDLLIDGEKFFPAFVQSVLNATRSVDVLVYIFDTDDYAVALADLLKKRSTVIKVKVLLDDMGSLFSGQSEPASPVPSGFQRPSSIESYLREGSRVRVRASANPWLTVDHRKCIIIDGREAYIGGMNIGRNYRYDWHDMMVRLTGPIVGHLEKDYRLTWAHAGPLGDFAYLWGWLFDRTAPRKNPVAHPDDIRPLRTRTGKRDIYRAQWEAIERSRCYIYIETPYLDDASIVRALLRARQRGVDVRVILPAQNDSGAMQVNNDLMASDLVRGGVRLYSYPGMTHVKAAIYDGWACLGSANFDKMSLHVGQELDVAFSDSATVGELKAELFEKDFARSREITEPSASNWLDSFVKAFTDQL